MNDDNQPDPGRIKSVLLIHGGAPLMNYDATLLGRSVISLEKQCKLQASFNALCQRRYDLAIIEPQLVDGDALLLALEIVNNLLTARPTILRVGAKAQLGTPWPINPAVFDSGEGLSAFNQKLVKLLRLQHRQAQRFAIRVNFKQQSASAILGQSVAISACGMLFSSAKKLAIGAVIDLEFMGVRELREERISGLILRQEPVRSRFPCYAIEFRQVSPEQQMRINRYFADDSGGMLQPPQEI